MTICYDGDFYFQIAKETANIDFRKYGHGSKTTTMMEDLLEEDEGLQIKRRHQPLFRKDRHLSSALITTEIDYLIAQKDNPKGLKREHITSKSTEYMTSKEFLSWAIVNWQDFCHTQDPITKLTTALKIAQHALRISVKDYTSHYINRHITPSLELTLLYKAKNNFDKVLEVITYSTEFHQSYQLGKYACDAYGNLHLIWSTDKKCWIITHSHLVALRDVINSWFSVTLYGTLADTKYPGYSLAQEIGKYLHAGRELHRTHGSLCYKLYKMWPSLVIACILRDTECKSTLYNTIMKDTLD